MIIVRETKKGFETLSVSQNPIVYSLDGTEKTRLNVLMAESWSDEDRARFGVHKVEPFMAPEGMVTRGPAQFVKGKDGKVRMEAEVATKPAEAPPTPSKYEILLQQFEELNARVAVLEDEKAKRDARG